MVARGAEHRDAGRHRQKTLDMHVLAADIDDAAQSLADILEDRPAAESVDARYADGHRRFHLHFQQFAGEQEDIAVELRPRPVEKRVGSELELPPDM